MRILALDHVQLAMPPGREEEARGFYSGVLGIEELPKPPKLAARGGCWFHSGPIRVHLGVQEDFRPATKAHVGFEVDDLDEARARLEAAGAPVEDGTPVPGAVRLFTTDPFGNRLELLAVTD